MRCSTTDTTVDAHPSFVRSTSPIFFLFHSFSQSSPPPALNVDRFLALLLSTSFHIPHQRHEAPAANWPHHAVEQLVRVLLPSPPFRGYPFCQPSSGAHSSSKTSVRYNGHMRGKVRFWLQVRFFPLARLDLQRHRRATSSFGDGGATLRGASAIIA